MRQPRPLEINFAMESLALHQHAFALQQRWKWWILCDNYKLIETLDNFRKYSLVTTILKVFSLHNNTPKQLLCYLSPFDEWVVNKWKIFEWTYLFAKTHSFLPQIANNLHGRINLYSIWKYLEKKLRVHFLTYRDISIANVKTCSSTILSYEMWLTVANVFRWFRKENLHFWYDLEFIK